jgi:hypothetical protein
MKSRRKFYIFVAVLLAITAALYSCAPQPADDEPSVIEEPSPPPPSPSLAPSPPPSPRPDPPKASAVYIEKVICDRPLDPNDFVTDITGRAPVAASFFLQPDNRREGEQSVFVTLTDAGGITAIIRSTLTLTRDDEPPVISGLIHKTVFVGDTIAYRLGVIVTDNIDEHVVLEVDSGAVDLREEGVYEVIFSATDSSGNTVSVEGSVTVHSVTREMADELADEVLDMILEEDMTPLEVVRAIYEWVKFTLHYSSSFIKDNVALAAYRGLTYFTGDCYIYYATAEVLLSRAGIENLPVQNIEEAVTRHFWSLVDIGEGWHHFDTTPHETGVTGFMLTESQAQTHVPNRSRTYYTYDPELYPEVVP